MAQVTSPIILDSTGQQIHSDLQQIKTVLTTPSAAEDITFDNTGTGMQADDVQDAITELKSNLTQLDGLTVYRNLTPQTSYADFDDGSTLPLISLTSNIDTIQEGSGNPSPTNIRPISGHTEINISVSPTTDPQDATVYTVEFKDGSNPLTVYGGTLDVVSGKLVVDRGYMDLGTLNYTYYSGNLFTTVISNLKPVVNSDLCNALCSIYVAKLGNEYASIDGSFVAGFNNASILAIYDSRFSDATAFKTAMNGVQLVYELATPQTYQLTPTQVNSLLGQNYIFSDTGNVTNVKYIGVLNFS